MSIIFIAIPMHDVTIPAVAIESVPYLFLYKTPFVIPIRENKNANGDKNIDIRPKIKEIIFMKKLLSKILFSLTEKICMTNLLYC